jgi:hypothetical protein
MGGDGDAPKVQAAKAIQCAEGQELIVLSESIIKVINLLSFITFAVTSKLNGIGVEIHIIIKILYLHA